MLDEVKKVLNGQTCGITRVYRIVYIAGWSCSLFDGDPLMLTAQRNCSIRKDQIFLDLFADCLFADKVHPRVAAGSLDLDLHAFIDV